MALNSNQFLILCFLFFWVSKISSFVEENFGSGMDEGVDQSFEILMHVYISKMRRHEKSWLQL
jgi:hypothetical protein